MGIKNSVPDFLIFICVKSKLDESCDEIVYFHVLQSYVL